MHYAITVDGGRITGVHESSFHITSGTFAESPLFAGQEVFSVSEMRHSKIENGRYIGEYTEEWILKPLQQRVDDGFFTVPDGCVIDGEDIREMTHDEKIVAGLEQEPEPQQPDPKVWLLHELTELYQWFHWYDIQVAQYGRAQRMGAEFDKDISALDAEAAQNQARIREILNAVEEA